MMDAEIRGERELRRRLKSLSTKLQKRVARKSTREGLRPTLAELKRTAARRSGALARSVKLRSMKRSRRRVGSRITTTAPHAASYHYGNRRQQATRWQSRAVATTRNATRRRATSTAKSEINAVVKSLGPVRSN